MNKSKKEIKTNFIDYTKDVPLDIRISACKYCSEQHISGDYLKSFKERPSEPRDEHICNKCGWAQIN